jgi:DNA-binding response OmpR family regulator
VPAEGTGVKFPSFLDQVIAYDQTIVEFGETGGENRGLSGPRRRFRMLAIDPDGTLIGGIEGSGQLAGWEIVSSHTAVRVGRLLRMKLDLLFLDPSSLGADGWRYLDCICQGAPELDLIVCSDRVSRERRVRGLREGVDDWITKPMDPLEVVARIEAVSRLRRVDETVARRPMQFGELSVEPQYMQARIDGENLALTRRELDLLVALAETEGQVLGRKELYRRAWGYSMPPGDRSVDVFVSRLRQKLEEKSRHCYIHTHFGIGYRFEPARSEGAGGEHAVTVALAGSTSLC